MLSSAILSLVMSAPGASTLVVVDAPELDDQQVRIFRSAGKRAATRGRGKWVEGPKVSLVDVQAMLGCGSFDAKCAGSLASLVKADRALWVKAKPVGEFVDVNVSVVNKKGSVRARAGPYVLVGKKTKEHLIDIFSSTLKGKPIGHVLVESEPSGARVKIDGSSLGTTPLMLTGEWRSMKLELAKDGFVIGKQTVSVPRKKTTRVSVTLKSAPKVVEPVEDPVVPKKDPEPQVKDPPPDKLVDQKDPPDDPVIEPPDDVPPGGEDIDPMPASEGLGVLPAVIVTSGAVTLAAAGGLYGTYWAMAAGIDKETRLANAPVKYADEAAQAAEDRRADDAYRTAFEARHKDIRGLLYGSWVAAAVGATVLVAGAGLMLFE